MPAPRRLERKVLLNIEANTKVAFDGAQSIYRAFTDCCQCNDQIVNPGTFSGLAQQTITFQSLLGRTGVKTLYIEQGSPWENGHCESLNSSYGTTQTPADDGRVLT